MKIESLIGQQADENLFLYLERYVNAGSKTYSPFSHQTEAQSQYQPDSDIDAFEVPCLQLPKEKVSIFFDLTNEQLLNRYIQNDTVLFPIHPQTYEDDKVFFIEELRKYPTHPILVSSTASTRTVMIKDPVPHFIKLHFPRRISRFIRRLRVNILQHCIEISKDLKQISLSPFAFLPEVLGVAYGAGQEAWGFLVREFQPWPRSEGKRKLLIPFFALYSQDSKHPDDLPLLIQLIQFLRQDPVSFILNHIMQPLIQIWCTIARERGILLEMHGQNTLLELDEHLKPTRIVYRDLDLYVDDEIREKKQLPINFPTSHIIKEPREKIFSVKYDAFIGHHLFDYLTDILEKFYEIDSKRLHNACKETFRTYFPDADLYFSDKTYYYADELLLDNKIKIIETADPPKWRPLHNIK